VKVRKKKKKKKERKKKRKKEKEEERKKEEEEKKKKKENGEVESRDAGKSESHSGELGVDADSAPSPRRAR
jgi:hypothetical protein